MPVGLSSLVRQEQAPPELTGLLNTDGSAGLAKSLAGGLIQGAVGLPWLYNKLADVSAAPSFFMPQIPYVDEALEYGENLAGEGQYQMAGEFPGASAVGAVAETAGDILTPEPSDAVKAAPHMMAMVMSPQVMEAVGKAFQKVTGKSLDSAYKAPGSAYPEIGFHSSPFPIPLYGYDMGLAGSGTGAYNTKLGQFFMGDGPAPGFAYPLMEDPITPTTASYVFHPREGGVLELDDVLEEMRQLEVSGLFDDFHDEASFESLGTSPSQLNEFAGGNFTEEYPLTSSILGHFPNYLRGTLDQLDWKYKTGKPDADRITAYDLSKAFVAATENGSVNAGSRARDILMNDMGVDLLRFTSPVDATLVYGKTPVDQVTQMVAVDPNIATPLAYSMETDLPPKSLAESLMSIFKGPDNHMMGSPFADNPDLVNEMFGPWASRPATQQGNIMFPPGMAPEPEPTPDDLDWLMEALNEDF